MRDGQPGLRELTRRAVRKEITDAANRLFVEKGYAATTIDDIAAEIGMSPRSVFRYFPTKEAIVVGKFDLVAEEMLRTLLDRPNEEPVWTSLRRIFDLLVPYVDAPGKSEVADPMQRIVFATPALLASYLEKLHLMQDAAEAAIRDRARAAGTPYAEGDPAPRALVGAAFGCLIAAQRSWLASSTRHTFAEALDHAMTIVGPTTQENS